ncbi:MAG: hypothetical protein IKA85_03105 [Clostridia bacterium]|nr:hypothetical protein [Clostridia bacterium]
MRIRFKGEISKESKKYIVKQLDKGYRLMILGFPIIFFLVVAPMTIIDAPIIARIMFVSVVCIVWLLLCFCPRMHYKPLDIINNYPIRIDVEDGRIITDGKDEKAYQNREFIDVKKVIDCGNFYYVKYYWPFYRYTLCQKDLIIEGTIEEFEQLFEDKIVRKTK